MRRSARAIPGRLSCCASALPSSERRACFLAAGGWASAAGAGRLCRVWRLTVPAPPATHPTPPTPGRVQGAVNVRFPMERNRGPEVGPEAELEEGEPEVKKRRLLCVEFASVASCDAAVAQCYLAENDWEMEVSFRCFSLAGSLPWWCRRTSHPCVFVLQRALNSYFEPAGEESASESRPESPSEPESCVDLTKEETNDSVSSKTSTSEDKSVQQEDGSVFSFITWNIDGLDMNNLLERARGVCSYLAL